VAPLPRSHMLHLSARQRHAITVGGSTVSTCRSAWHGVGHDYVRTRNRAPACVGIEPSSSPLTALD